MVLLKSSIGWLKKTTPNKTFSAENFWLGAGRVRFRMWVCILIDFPHFSGLEEKKVGFHEHVFLEHHLVGWCPKQGPVRHFMELVCTGLSKNPYLTVERKKRHIEWYKNYFEAKKDILKETKAIEAKQ